MPRPHRFAWLAAGSLTLGAWLNAAAPAVWRTSGHGGGGGIFGYAINPLDANEVFATCDMSELFRSTDGGATWTTVDFRQLQLSLTITVQFSTHPVTRAQTLYAADLRYNAGENGVARVMQSTDHGVTWQAMPGWSPGTYISQVFADPSRPGRVFVNDAAGFGAGAARLHVTQNGGADGFPVALFDGSTTGLGAFARIGGIFCDPDANLVFVAASSGLFFSSDGGSTFVRTSGPGDPTATEGVIALAAAKDAAGVRFYCTTGPKAGVDLRTHVNAMGATTNRVYRLDWARYATVPQAPTWTLEMSGIASGDYPNLVAMSPTDTTTAYLAGRRNAYPTGTCAYRTSGPGTGWTSVLFPLNNQNVLAGWGGINDRGGAGNRQIESELSWNIPGTLAVAASNPDVVFLADNSVMHKTTNGRSADVQWTQIYTDNLGRRQGLGSPIVHGGNYGSIGFEPLVAFSVEWVDRNNIWIGHSDNKVLHSADGGRTWAFDYHHETLPSGDAYQVRAYRGASGQAHNGTLYTFATQLISPYGFSATADANVDFVRGTAGVYKLSPGSQDWIPIGTDFNANPAWITLDEPGDRLFVAIAHSTPARAGFWRLDRVSTGAGLWVHLGLPAARTAGNDIVHPYNLRVLGPNRLLASYSGRVKGSAGDFIDASGVFLSTDGGTSWSDVSDPGLRYYTQDVVVDPHDPTQKTWYAAVWNTGTASGNTSGGLYRTINEGASWQRIWAGVAPTTADPLGVGGSVTSLTINPDPAFRQEAYLSTRYGGLFHTGNLNDPAGVTWTQLANYPFRAPSRVFFNPYDSREVWVTSNGNGTRIGLAPLPPAISTHPESMTVAVGNAVTFTAASSSVASPSVQWQRNGRAIAGATAATVTVTPATAANAGLYTAQFTDAGGTARTTAAILGLAGASKLTGAASEIAANIVHPNGNTYDQVLLEGAAATVNADPGQIVRISFIDLTDDIVQVEFSGAGTLTVMLEGASGPAPPLNYNQAVNYLKGHAALVVAGADETTNLSVFSVGSITAVNPSLFRSGVTYDGLADLAFVAITSRNGRFGGLRTANANYFATEGFTGVYAPGVQFTGPVYVGDINASGQSTPVLLVGSAADVRVAGGDLAQTNQRPVSVGGFSALAFTDGITSHGAPLPAQANRARLEQNGVDVTAALVAAPTR